MYAVWLDVQQNIQPGVTTLNIRHQVYESIGVGYASARRPDPPIYLLIVDALGDARTVLNVGAGGGNYEPSERSVIAVEPSLKMISQRRYGSGPALQGVAEALPFSNKSFDAALATFTLHHWTDVSAGLLELKRVAKRQVILLFEPAESLKLWLVEYFPECLALPSETGAPGVNDVRPVLDVRNVTPFPCRQTAPTGLPELTGGGPRRTRTRWCGRESPVWHCFHRITPSGAHGDCGRAWRRGHGMPGLASWENCLSSIWGTGWLLQDELYPAYFGPNPLAENGFEDNLTGR